MQFPHCDARVLHAPGKCEYCDRRPEWQRLRETWNIAFTGEDTSTKAPCPAEAARGRDSVNRWGGNRAFDEQEARRVKAAELRLRAQLIEDGLVDE